MLELESRRPGKTLVAALPAFLGQRITYLMASALTAVVYYALLGLGLLVGRNAVPYLFLVAGSHLATVLIVYPVYRLAVFATCTIGWVHGYLRFYAVGLTFLGASLAGLPLLVEIAGMPLMGAQALIILLSPPLSYAVNRAWAFR
ncbi:GtrA family protein [Microbispora sp. CA-102843]|uniref:GtrA family protein n=1 Tax=Microbispora sp. CA-102843 TaxID=3239952 RepID=UPI003D8F3DA8